MSAARPTLLLRFFFVHCSLFHIFSMGDICVVFFFIFSFLSSMVLAFTIDVAIVGCVVFFIFCFSPSWFGKLVRLLLFFGCLRSIWLIFTRLLNTMNTFVMKYPFGIGHIFCVLVFRCIQRLFCSATTSYMVGYYSLVVLWKIVDCFDIFFVCLQCFDNDDSIAFVYIFSVRNEHQQ